MDPLNASLNRLIGQMSGDPEIIKDALDVEIQSRSRYVPDPQREPFDARLIDAEPKR